MASESLNRTPNGILVFLGSGAAFVVVAAVFVILLSTKGPGDQIEPRRAAQRLEARLKVDAEAHAKLNSEGWVDKAKGIVHVPITDAMTMVVAELTAKKPAPSSVKVEPPLPMPVIDPTSTEPPQAALTSAPQGADTMRFAPPATAATPAPAPAKPAEPAPAPTAPSIPPAPAIPPKPAIPPAPAPEKPAAPEPAAPNAPAAPPVINPTENPAPTK